MIELIPAVDLIGGKCVRLTQGDYAQRTVYADDPVEMAKRFEGIGLRRLHLVDLDGAKAGRLVNLSVLEKIARATSLLIDFGGGIKTQDDLRAVMGAGAGLAVIGSVAVKAPERVHEWIGTFGADKFFLGADVREEKIAVSGWLEQTELDIYDFVNGYAARGLKTIFCTDISRDGLLRGPATELYKKMSVRCPGIRLTASGGVSSMNDIAALEEAGCAGAIVGKAIYEGKITLAEMEAYMKNTNKE